MWSTTTPLYRRGFNQSQLKCLSEEDGNYVLREIHEGICDNHTRGSSLAQKVIRQGYYWSTLKEDASKFARSCDKCQIYANFINSHVAPLTSLVSP